MVLKDSSSKRYCIALIALYCVIQLCKTAICSENLGSVTGLPLPRFISLKSNETNLRTGPSSHYPIKLNYQCKNYPLQITAEFNNWRLLTDIDGSQGWVHSSLISGKRYAVIINNSSTNTLPFKIPHGEAILFKSPKEDSYPVARIEIGAIVMLKKCDALWCKVSANKYQGWVQKINLWGIQNNEIINK